MDRSGPVAQLRSAVAAFAGVHLSPVAPWAVALSGGADSLALAAVAAMLRPTTALVVDHGLQDGSDQVAATARDHAMQLGCVDAQILRVEVGAAGGPEAAARIARYRALDDGRDGLPVLLGHTLDDQAETVLLGLGRGSGARSIAGMRPFDDPWCRPLLGQRRTTTVAACAELGLTPWHDPHNTDPRFTRVRLRTEVLPLLEEVLGGGVAAALARTATALREDTEALDTLADTHATDDDTLDVSALAVQSSAVRRRVIRRWLLGRGARDLNDGQLRAVEALITEWRGQGGVAVPNEVPGERLFVARRGGLLTLYREPVG